MFKLLKKIKFDEKENRMSNVGAIEEVIENFSKNKNKNLKYLLSKRYSWMNDFIEKNDIGLEIGAGSGLSKKLLTIKI